MEGEATMITRISFFSAFLIAILSIPLLGASASGTVLVSGEAAQTVVISNLTAHEGSVSGTIVNESPATVERVTLLLRQEWRWTDERHPGDDNPGRALPLALGGQVAPHASAPFTFAIPPLPERSDGRFVTTMDVVSFTEVTP